MELRVHGTKDQAATIFTGILLLTGKNYQKMFRYDWNNSIVRMERNWEEFDARISSNDSGLELDAWDAPNESQSAEGEGERIDVGGVLGETPIQKGPDNLYPLWEENG